ncbi:unnamed protein product [Peniophora sp. CBMAI 1063]|nr:unnamed protein product [Peniophora sp. CBMAI 1063]
MSALPPTYASASWDAHKQQRFRDLQYDTVISTGTLAQRAELLLQLESEHDAILALAKTVLHSRNACLPISALPPDVFVRIVTFVAQDDRPSGEILGRKFRVSTKWGCGFMRIIGVCKRWRSMCLEATELWTESEAPAPYFSAGSLASETLRKRMIPVPALFPAVRELRLLHLRMSHEETLNLVSHLPMLEVLELRDCALGDTNARSESEVAELPRLQQLMLVALYSAAATHDELGIHAPLFRMHDSLRYPRSAAVKLAPKLTADWGVAAADAKEISVLRTLVLRVLDIVNLPNTSICAHLGLSDYRDETGSNSDSIYFREVTDFNAIAAPVNNGTSKGANIQFWRAVIGPGELPMSSVFGDPVIADILGSMAMLSMPDTSIFQLDKVEAMPALLSHAFRRIRILRVSIESSEHEMAIWRLLSQLLSADAKGGLRFPDLQELWFGPYSCRRKDLPLAIKRLVKRLQTRARHPANRIHTMRLGIARPEGQGEEGIDASVLESLFLTVNWADS